MTASTVSSTTTAEKAEIFSLHPEGIISPTRFVFVEYFRSKISTSPIQLFIGTSEKDCEFFALNMEDQVSKLVENAWARFQETPSDRRLCMSPCSLLF